MMTLIILILHTLDQKWYPEEAILWEPLEDPKIASYSLDRD